MLLFPCVPVSVPVPFCLVLAPRFFFLLPVLSLLCLACRKEPGPPGERSDESTADAGDEKEEKKRGAKTSTSIPNARMIFYPRLVSSRSCAACLYLGKLWFFVFFLKPARPTRFEVQVSHPSTESLVQITEAYTWSSGLAWPDWSEGTKPILIHAQSSLYSQHTTGTAKRNHPPPPLQHLRTSSFWRRADSIVWRS